jgi:hypothetical protein
MAVGMPLMVFGGTAVLIGSGGEVVLCFLLDYLMNCIGAVSVVALTVESAASVLPVGCLSMQCVEVSVILSSVLHTRMAGEA